MDVVIVESPAKAKTINKYLGPGYEVYASFGHVRDLPSQDGAVDPDDDFAMKWEVDFKASKRLSEIAAAVKDADTVILATDPDREGEAISWHVLEILKSKKVLKDKRVQRVVFNAITKTAILDAMKAPREIDTDLVDAYLARRALDYLVGFKLSPVLWRKLPGAKSAGRVQSVALRLVCDRELDIEKFKPREYWSLEAFLQTKAGAPFSARLIGADGKKINRLDIGTGTEAESFKAGLETATFSVTSVESKPAKRHPYPPFTTSTLQQEASRKLGLAPARTMQIAQRLYEDGIITYMRTDGVDMAPEAIAGARRVIEQEFGGKYLPGVPRKYSAKAKNAQEAHEAVRPTDLGRLPREFNRSSENIEQAKLYELIWTRTIASQMESAELERTSVDIAAHVNGGAYKQIDLRATGQVVRFDGFLKLYQEGRDDDDDEDANRLPLMSQGEALTKERIEAVQHFTEPPPRFTEATLVKRMEELGIGRPSTYASTLAVLRDREYVRLDKKRLVPEDRGRLVVAFLESFFTRYVEYDFTAALEEKLDLVTSHDIHWKQLLRDFWAEFSVALAGTADLRTTQVLDALNDLLAPHIFPEKEGVDNPRACPACAAGQLSLKLSKFGAFVGCTNYPECKFTRAVSPNAEGDASGRPGVKVLGRDPATDLEVSVRNGRFGPYVQLGEEKDSKKTSLPKGLSTDEVTFEQALGLLSLPREVAKHPTSGDPILAGIGRYGSYVQHQKTYANLGKDDDVLEIGANRAIDLITTKEQRGGGGRFAGRDLGDHPTGGKIAVKAGRFGAYVAWNKINATIPKGTDPDSFTLEQAVALIEAKQNGTGGDAGGGKSLGVHPAGGAVSVRAGRYGPYVNWGKVNATIPKSQSPDDITLEEALMLIEEKAGPGAARKAAKKAPKKAAAKKTAAKKVPAKKAPAKKAATKKAPTKKKAVKKA